jgi:hypothetical protein
MARGGLIIDHHSAGNWDSYQLRQSSGQPIKAKRTPQPKGCTTQVRRVKS